MKLGTYTFVLQPDKYTLPRVEKSAAFLLTYTSVAYFSWGTMIAGKQILLEWDKVFVTQFEELDALFVADLPITWDPQRAKITHSAATNGPFLEGRILTGLSTGATGIVAGVASNNLSLELVLLTGTFTVGETIRDNGKFPLTSAPITVVDHPTYTVEIIGFVGDYIDLLGPRAPYRANVKMGLLILAEL